MRGYLLCASVSLAIASMVACASQGESEVMRPVEDVPTPDLPPVDGGVPDAELDAALVPPSCSDAGWCVTALPDADLVFKDIWALPGRAFAVAESPTLGVKVLEWNDATAAWKYIDDNTQNDPGFGAYATSIWASDENDVYFTVAPGTVYHGKRGAPPDTAWSWTRYPLTDNSPDHNPSHDHGNPTYSLLTHQSHQLQYPALGVWGTGAGDVYAWYANTIYRWASVDGGADGWIPEYIAGDVDDPSEHFFVLSAAGTSRDDVWFSITRDRTYQGSCAVLMHKTEAGYRRVTDGVVSWGPCAAREGAPTLGGTEGWLTDLQAPSANRLIGLKGTREVVAVAVAGNDVSATSAPVPMNVAGTSLFSLWAAPADASGEQLWLSGWGIVARGSDLWDGGAYGVSTISLNGAPLNRPMYRVRGLSNSNLWAIGALHALHKTTP